jgi:argininosuccinate lyase
MHLSLHGAKLVNLGRSRGLRPADLAYADARRIYAESARAYQQTPSEFPLSEAEFRRALTPENMVQSAQGLGGPQRSEIVRMLAGRARAARIGS